VLLIYITDFTYKSFAKDQGRGTFRYKEGVFLIKLCRPRYIKGLLYQTVYPLYMDYNWYRGGRWRMRGRTGGRGAGEAKRRKRGRGKTGKAGGGEWERGRVKVRERKG
jgi:hypothetical protein